MDQGPACVLAAVHPFAQRDKGIGKCRRRRWGRIMTRVFSAQRPSESRRRGRTPPLVLKAPLQIQHCLKISSRDKASHARQTSHGPRRGVRPRRRPFIRAARQRDRERLSARMGSHHHALPPTQRPSGTRRRGRTPPLGLKAPLQIQHCLKISSRDTASRARQTSRGPRRGARPRRRPSTREATRMARLPE